VTTVVIPSTLRVRIRKVNRLHDALGRFASKGGGFGGGRGGGVVTAERRTPEGITYLATNRSGPSKTFDPMRRSSEQRTTSQNEAVSRLVQHSPWSTKAAHEAVKAPPRDLGWKESHAAAAKHKAALSAHADAIVGKTTPNESVRAMLAKPLQRAHEHLDLAAKWGASPIDLALIKGAHENFMTTVGYRKKFGGGKG
jgi:hypothetical protein